LYKFNEDILKLEYPHLCTEGDTKKLLPLYPNILLKCNDLKENNTNKEKF